MAKEVLQTHDIDFCSRPNSPGEIEITHLIDSISLASGKLVNLDEKLFNLVDAVVTTVAFGKSYRGKQFEGQMLKDVLDETMNLG